MATNLTKEMLRSIVDAMKITGAKYRTVNNRKEARKLTANDPFGKAWIVGDNYYLVIEQRGKWAYAEEE